MRTAAWNCTLEVDQCDDQEAGRPKYLRPGDLVDPPVPLAFLVWSGWMLLVAQNRASRTRARDCRRKTRIARTALLQLQQAASYCGDLRRFRSVARWRELYRNYRNQVKQLDGGTRTREVMNTSCGLHRGRRTERIASNC